MFAWSVAGDYFVMMKSRERELAAGSRRGAAAVCDRRATVRLLAAGDRGAQRRPR